MKTVIQCISFPMHCKCKTIKPLVTLVWSKPWFLSLLFGHKRKNEKLNNRKVKFGSWENASHIIKDANDRHFMHFSVFMELHENCMTSIFGQPGKKSLF